MVASPNKFSLDTWRREFAINDSYVYLDHATLGPMPKASVEAIQASVAAHAVNGSLAFPGFHTMAEAVRGSFSKLIGADRDEIAITSSTAMGINIIANGLSWREGDAVVVPAVDFPANMYPWMHLAAKGVEVRRVPPRDGRITTEDFLAACDSKTRVVAVSLVQFSTGFRVAIEALGEACRSRGILLVVDGMQAIGWANIDVHELPIDVMALQSYKWLLGPFGVGWLYIRHGLIEQVEPLAVGSRSVTPRESFLDHRFELSPTATRYETGVLNLHGIAGVGASLEILTKVGMAVIEAHVLSLADRLAEGLAVRGCDIVSARTNVPERSPIVVFRHPKLNASVCHRKLIEAGVVVSLREGAIRTSPHFYNTNNDIDRLLDALH